MFLKNKNIIFKIRRSKVTDYAALNRQFTEVQQSYQQCFREEGAIHLQNGES